MHACRTLPSGQPNRWLVACNDVDKGKQGLVPYLRVVDFGGKELETSSIPLPFPADVAGSDPTTPSYYASYHTHIPVSEHACHVGIVPILDKVLE